MLIMRLMYNKCVYSTPWLSHAAVTITAQRLILDMLAAFVLQSLDADSRLQAE